MTLWVAGRTWQERGTHQWDIIGIFDEEDKAVARCHDSDHPSRFVAPVKLNEALPEEVNEWPDAYFVD